MRSSGVTGLAQQYTEFWILIKQQSNKKYPSEQVVRIAHLIIFVLFGNVGMFSMKQENVFWVE